MSLYSEKQRNAVIFRAMQVVEARRSGKEKAKFGGQEFILGPVYHNKKPVGYCNRFIRQVFETVLCLGTFGWYFGDTNAKRTLNKLAPYQLHLEALQPGDILGWDDEDAGQYGHIALYVGDYYGDGRLLVAENTSAKRGDPKPPGTKITALKNMRKGYKAFRLFPEV